MEEEVYEQISFDDLGIPYMSAATVEEVAAWAGEHESI